MKTLLLCMLLAALCAVVYSRNLEEDTIKRLDQFDSEVQNVIQDMKTDNEARKGENIIHRPMATQNYNENHNANSQYQQAGQPYWWYGGGVNLLSNGVPPTGQGNGMGNGPPNAPAQDNNQGNGPTTNPGQGTGPRKNNKKKPSGAGKGKKPTNNEKPKF